MPFNAASQAAASSFKVVTGVGDVLSRTNMIFDIMIMQGLLAYQRVFSNPHIFEIPTYTLTALKQQFDD